MNLHSVAQDVTTSAPLESLFLKILESTSYPIKNITKEKKPASLSLCVSIQTQTFSFVRFPFFGVKKRFSSRSVWVPCAVLCPLLLCGQLPPSQEGLF